MPNSQRTQYMIDASVAKIAPPITTGKTFYVCSAGGNTGVAAADDAQTLGGSGGQAGQLRGSTPVYPYATLAYALTKTTASVGDVIVLMPGHAEAVIAAATIACATAGVTIMGLGNGRNRPTFTWTTIASATWTVTAANVRISNCVFLMNGIDQLVSGMVITAADCEIDHCEFNLSADAGTAVSAILGILTAATAARLYIHDCFFHCPITITTNTVTAAIQHEVGVDFRINDNVFWGKMTQAILNATTILRGEISGNRFQIYTGTAAVTLANATQCFLANNRMSVASGTAPIAGAAASFCFNQYTTEGNGPTAGTALTF